MLMVAGMISGSASSASAFLSRRKLYTILIGLTSVKPVWLRIGRVWLSWSMNIILPYVSRILSGFMIL